ncbi:MAG: hypothetical protein OXF62_14515 [Caldilineaceae bacterium]|nr:hypothetical protein [Caldilineaceae bacterium]MCY4092027.1 hypothetical protein [Caldilineaceae bacterium]MCY4116604.1 hypothetical protein [Caldilineaceae bacterium]
MRKYLITGIVLLALLAPGLLMAQTDLTLESLAARDRKPDFQSRRSLCLTGRLRSAPGRRRNSHRADTCAVPDVNTVPDSNVDGNARTG